MHSGRRAKASMRAIRVYRAFRDINTACRHAVVDFDTVSALIGQLKLTGDLGENPRAAHSPDFKSGANIVRECGIGGCCQASAGQRPLIHFNREFCVVEPVH